MNVLGQPNFPMIFQSPSRPDSVESLGQVNKGRVEVARALPYIFPEVEGQQISCRWFLGLRGSRMDFQGGDLAPGGPANS